MFSIFAMCIAMLILRPDPQKSPGKEDPIKNFDWSGTFISALFLLSLMLVITFSNKLSLSSPYIILGTMCSILLFAAFLFREKTAKNPILPLSLFKSLSFSLGSSSRFISFTASSSTFFFASLKALEISRIFSFSFYFSFFFDGEGGFP